MLAQGLQLGDVDLLDVREVRNLAFRLGHALGDDAPQTDHFDFRGFCRGSRGDLRRGGRAGGCLPLDVLVEVRTGDTPTRAGSGNEPEIDAHVLRPAAYRR